MSTNLRDNKKTKKILRTIGFIVGPIGLILAITAFVDFFVSLGSMNQPKLFWMFFIGFPFIFVGIICLSMGYMKEVSSFVASEQAPVAKDVTNYMLKETREETTETAKSVVDAIKGKAPICPFCGTQNEAGAKFCDACGKPLEKVCECGEANDADAKYCRKCGKTL